VSTTLAYTAVVTNKSGASTFEDCTIELTEQHVVEGVPPLRIGNLPSTAGVRYLRSDSFNSAPHPAPGRQWVVLLRGAIELRVSTGESRQFGAGDLLLLTDISGQGHATVTVGTGPYEVLFIPLEGYQ
jgi:hypothetical protein